MPPCGSKTGENLPICLLRGVRTGVYTHHMPPRRVRTGYIPTICLPEGCIQDYMSPYLPPRVGIMGYIPPYMPPRVGIYRAICLPTHHGRYTPPGICLPGTLCRWYSSRPACCTDTPWTMVPALYTVQCDKCALLAEGLRGVGTVLRASQKKRKGEKPLRREPSLGLYPRG